MGQNHKLIELIEKEEWTSVLKQLKTRKGKKELQKPGLFGRLPIHYAAERNTSTDVIQELVNGYPKGLQQRDNDGRLPIHLAAEKINASTDVIQQLVNGYPKGLQQQDNDGRLPIHRATGYTTSTDVIQQLIDAYPCGLRQSDESGWLPIHHAAKSNTSKDIIQQLIKAYPEGLQYQNLSGLLPIHLAAKNTTSVDFIKELIKAYPEGLQHRDYFEKLPIHHAAENNTSMDVIKELIKAYPKGLQHPVERGRLPIHLAAKNNTSVDVIKELIKAYPEGLQHRDCYWSLPIHRAAENNTSVDVIQQLLINYPEGCKKRNDEGQTPKDVAWSKSRPHTIISCFNEAEESLKLSNNSQHSSNANNNNYHESLLHKQKNSGQTPEAVVVSQNEPQTILSCIITCLMKARENLNFSDSNQHSNTAKNNKPSVLESTTSINEKSTNDNFSNSRQTLVNAFKGEYTMANIPTVTPQYLSSCKQEKIGEGGNGTVFLAKDYAANIVFVIKEYHNDSSAEKELQILSKFQHPYVVKLLAQAKNSSDCGSSKHSLVLEYMPKGSLADVLENVNERKNLTFIQRVSIASNITAALCYLHNLEGNNDSKIFHRDVKSANICLNDDFTAKIIDCGISKELCIDATHVSDTNGSGVGSIGYKAPEYAKGSRKYNEKCEAYSLGIVFVEILTGRKTNGDSHFEQFDKNKSPFDSQHNVDQFIKDEIDQNNCVSQSVDDFCALALHCISSCSEDRPTLREIQNRLNSCLSCLQSDIDIKQPKNESLVIHQSCQICSEDNSTINCCGKHFLCQRHFIDHVLLNLEEQRIPCICHNICQQHFTDVEIGKVPFARAMKHAFARGCASERAKESSLLPILKQINSNVLDVKNINQEMQQKLDTLSTRLLKAMLSLAGGRVSCPTLFWLVPENSKPQKTKASLREWLNKSISKTWLLYFVCAHDRKPVCPPIELKCTRDWLKKVAPALKLMLIMTQLTLKATTSLSFDLSVIPLHSGAEHDDQLEGMIDFTNNLLGAEAAKIIDKKAVEWERDGDGQASDFEKWKVIQHFGPDMQLAFDVIAAKAKENAEWTNHMKQVSSKEGLVWVRNQYVKYYKS